MVTQGVLFAKTLNELIIKINQHLNCHYKCLIYLLVCKVCKKQYTGKTVAKFRLRCNNYKQSDKKFLRGEEIKQKFLYQHFLKEGRSGFIEYNGVCLIDNTQSSDPCKKKYH